MSVTTLPVAALETCDRVRVRHQRPKEGSDIVLDYADAYRCGLITEPLDVFCEKGTERYVVADGENRLLALRSAKIKEVEVRLHQGDEVDALDFAIGCNQTHGLRRTKADKYHAFVRIMETAKLRDKYRTDTDLSEKIGVSKRTIADYKVQWRNSDGGSQRIREAKEKSRSSADRHALNGHARTEVGKAAPKIEKPAPKQKPKAAPKEDDGGGWTKADEKSSSDILDALHALGEAWKAGTRAAQIHCSEVIQKTVRDMR